MPTTLPWVQWSWKRGIALVYSDLPGTATCAAFQAIHDWAVTYPDETILISTDAYPPNAPVAWSGQSPVV